MFSHSLDPELSLVSVRFAAPNSAIRHHRLVNPSSLVEDLRMDDDRAVMANETLRVP